MAKEQDKKLVDEKLTRNIVVENGRQVFATDFSVKTYESEDGQTDSTETMAEHSVAGDGTIIAAAQAFRSEAQGGVVLRRCDACVDATKSFLHWLLHRHRPAMTWSPAKNMRRCFSCRQSLCEKHCVLSGDNHLRCRRCDRRFQIRQWAIRLARFLFLKQQ